MQNSMHGVAAGLLTCLRLMPSRRRRRRSGPLPLRSLTRSVVLSLDSLNESARVVQERI